ncbi:hypothetical protein C0J52_05738 [Blattella germanica]|nr:hypothetical protein C0J52_05738 [Blattella germanica]
MKKGEVLCLGGHIGGSGIGRVRRTPTDSGLTASKGHRNWLSVSWNQSETIDSEADMFQSRDLDHLPRDTESARGKNHRLAQTRKFQGPSCLRNGAKRKHMNSVKHFFFLQCDKHTQDNLLFYECVFHDSYYGSAEACHESVSPPSGSVVLFITGTEKERLRADLVYVEANICSKDNTTSTLRRETYFNWDVICILRRRYFLHPGHLSKGHPQLRVPDRFALANIVTNRTRRTHGGEEIPQKQETLVY